MQGNPDAGKFAFRIRYLGKVFSRNPESWAMKTEIQLKESGISLTIGVPLTETGIQCLKAGIRGVESGIHSLENTFLTFSLCFKGVV